MTLRNCRRSRVAPVALALVFLPAQAVLADGGGESAAEDPRIEMGRTVFLETAEPQCAICHTLADAGATGEIGPILDTMKPTYDVVYKAITEGIGPMTPYTDQLSEEQLDALAFYVSTVAGGAD